MKGIAKLVYHYVRKRCFQFHKYVHMPTLFIVTIEHIPNKDHIPLQWRHNDHDGVSNHQPDDCFAVSLICTWINGWVNNRETGDLKRHRAHYDVIVMQPSDTTGTTNQGSVCLPPDLWNDPRQFFNGLDWHWLCYNVIKVCVVQIYLHGAE